MRALTYAPALFSGDFRRRGLGGIAHNRSNPDATSASAKKTDRKAHFMSHPSNEQIDRWTIRELLENWVVWRDAGDWDRSAPSGMRTGV